MAKFTETVTREVKCPYCGDDAVSKWGKNANGKQTYRCKQCGKRFLHIGQVAGRHASAEQIGAAVRMYYGGTSYKQTAETLDDAFDMPEPSKETLYRWVTEYTQVAKDILADFPAHTSGKWVADEIQEGETDTDEPDEEWPPSPATVTRWRADSAQGMHARPSGGSGVVRIRQSKPKSKVIKSRKPRPSKHGKATAGRVASAQPKRAKRR